MTADRWPAQLLLVLLASLVAVEPGVITAAAAEKRSWNGTYTIVNKASGRRILSSKHGFSATLLGSIHYDHQWRFVAQGNDTFLIENAANRMRIFAQARRDNNDGFMTTDHGPIYQDQLWSPLPQADGSYALVNVRSTRRISARIGFEGGAGFVAVAGTGSILEDQAWWIINQERDDSGILRQQLITQRHVTPNLTNRASCGASMGERRRIIQEVADNTELMAQLRNRVLRHQAQGAVSNSAMHVTPPNKVHKAVASKLVIGRHLESEQRYVSCQELLDKAKIASMQVVTQLRQEVRAAGRNNTNLALEIKINKDKLARTSLQWTESLTAQYDFDSELGMCEEKNNELGSQAFEAYQIVAGLFAVVVLLLVLFRCAPSNKSRWRDADLTQQPLAINEADGSDLLATEIQCFSASNDSVTGEPTHIVKIQCPGVTHADVEVDLIWKGCDVTINRKASLGVEAMIWKRRFQFDHNDGLFEFKEDQMQLENGFLQLVFRAYSFQSRAVRFPQHFSMDSNDNEMDWEYSAEGEGSPNYECIHLQQSSPTKTKQRACASMSSMSTASSSQCHRQGAREL